MSNIESDSSDFWNLNKKSKNFKHDSESSDFWNLSKKKDSVYSSESLSTKSDDKNINNLEQEIITKEPKDKIEYKEEQSDLTPINIQNKKTFLPVNKITYKNKNIGDFTIKEFYYNFTKSIIDIIKSLKQGKGLNEIFSDQDKLIHFGIILIIISILLVPLTLN